MAGFGWRMSRTALWNLALILGPHWWVLTTATLALNTGSPGNPLFANKSSTNCEPVCTPVNRSYFILEELGLQLWALTIITYSEHCSHWLLMTLDVDSFAMQDLLIHTVFYTFIFNISTVILELNSFPVLYYYVFFVSNCTADLSSYFIETKCTNQKYQCPFVIFNCMYGISLVGCPFFYLIRLFSCCLFL